MSEAVYFNDFRAHLAQSTLYAKWKASNPREDKAINFYWDGFRARPTTIKTPFGLAFLAVTDAWVESQAMPYSIAPTGGSSG